MRSVELTTTIDANEAWEALRDEFAGDPAVSNGLLTAISRNAATGRAGFHYWLGSDGGAVVAAAMFGATSGRLEVTPMRREASIELAEAVRHDVPQLNGVLGPADTAASFAGRWTELTNLGARPTDGGRVLEVRDLTSPPSLPAGEVRLATLDDLDSLVTWNAGFAADTEVAPPPDPAALLSDHITSGSVWMWEGPAGQEAMSIRTAPVMRTRRIAHVYTPSAQRGRGLAAALVAHLASETLSAGDRCMLHTQLSNPSSNGVYRRLGFAAISESAFYEFFD